MVTKQDLQTYYKSHGIRLVMVADGEPRIHKPKNGKIVAEIPAGGVGIALDPIAQASGGIYISRGRTHEDRLVLDKTGKTVVENPDGNYLLKRVFFTDEELDAYYNGYANQTLWPLCHITFERPEFKKEWFEGYKKVNQKYAKAIQEEIKGKTFVWIHDYQLALVPSFLEKTKDVTLGMFWHIPWPTWEVFRILPTKRQILESMLKCDFIAFHRGYHVRNFLKTVERELETRIDEETSTVYYNKSKTVVRNLPLGVDVDVIHSFAESEEGSYILRHRTKSSTRFNNKIGAAKRDGLLQFLFGTNKVILGIDRLDYTKGLLLRFQAIDAFFEKNPQYVGSVAYLGIIAPSREAIHLYQDLKKDIKILVEKINQKYHRKNWKPIHILYEVFTRKEVIDFYKNSSLCLVTPRDDGMNLVSKEFVIASSYNEDPGMLVLSQFAGSSIDLTESLIVNPYDINEVAGAIKKGLEMNTKEKVKRIRTMVARLEEKNVYEWAIEFTRNALHSK